MRPGSEEYLDSEKYEVKRRTLDGPLLPLVAKLNAARRENPALQWLDPLTILETENEQPLRLPQATRRQHRRHGRQPRPDETTQVGVCVVPGLDRAPARVPGARPAVGQTWTWRIGRNYVKLGPGQSHVLGSAA